VDILSQMPYGSCDSSKLINPAGDAVRREQETAWDSQLCA